MDEKAIRAELARIESELDNLRDQLPAPRAGEVIPPPNGLSIMSMPPFVIIKETT